MDPISAAGIGLAVVPLVIQVFAGCMKGYQLLVEIEGMPSAYQHLRVRLRVEQTRLLNWGEKVGLVEELFDKSSNSLQLDRNLIFDVLLEIQTLFRSCVEIAERYDPIIPSKENTSSAEASFDRRFPRGTKSILNKVLSITEKAPHLGRRLQWAMIKQDALKSNVEKLIGYNDAIESLLDSTSITQLQAMQRQTYMAMLQLNSKVDELRQMSLAMHVKTQPLPQQPKNSLSRAPTLVAERTDGNDILASLADFKARLRLIEQEGTSVSVDPIKIDALVPELSSSTRSKAAYKGRPVWVEWKTHVVDDRYPPRWEGMIENRVKQLVTLLASPNKPKQFRAPECLGYCRHQTEEEQRYGFVYEISANASQHPATTPVSLLELIRTVKMPSLTSRKNLAHSISQSLMYLHSVDWLHKGIRSSNILFFISKGEKAALSEPTLAGFEYARPDLSGEETEPTPRYSQHDIYKHPETLNNVRSRSKKSDDIYSLGVVLAEIAHWRSIADLFPLPHDARAARKSVKEVRDFLLKPEFLENVEGATGEVYAEAMQKCLMGGEELGLYKNADETEPQVGAAMLEVYSTDIVGKLGDIRL